MVKNIRLFDLNNILITLKAMVVGIPIMIGSILIHTLAYERPLLLRYAIGAWMILSLFLWGHIARRMWMWK
jgi:hypothetical protein